MNAQNTNFISLHFPSRSIENHRILPQRSIIDSNGITKLRLRSSKRP